MNSLDIDSVQENKTRYRAFTEALMDNDNAVRPPGLDASGLGRFAVYRNNVHRALHEALSAAYPVVHKLVGDDFFHALAREYFTKEQTRSSSLSLYGADFANHVERFPPAQSLAYLADIARLERGYLEAMHSADAKALDVADLTSYSDSLTQLRFKAHPAARLIISEHPIFSIWQSNSTDETAEQTVEIVHKAESVLITRPALQTQVLCLSPQAGTVVRALLSGELVAKAFAKIPDDEQIDSAHVFSAVISTGAFERLI